MNAKAPHIIVIAGETSGDVLGADIIAKLKYLYPNAVFSGVGGDNMRRACPEFSSIFDMNDLAVMGVAEVLPNVITIWKRLKQVKSYITRQQPDMLVTIDAPDFNFRVVRAVRDKCPQTRFVHYVAPSVWAWREGRAANLAKIYDGLLCLLPFEPPYFTRHGLNAAYIGHPAYEAAKAYIGQEKLPSAKQTITILFGSRRGEFKRHSTIIIEAMRKIATGHPSVKFLIPYVPHLKEAIQNALLPYQELQYALIPAEKRYDAYFNSGFAIAVSGTVGLELALMGVPHVVCYRFNWLTAQIAKGVIKTPYAHLANILLGKKFIPEFIQNDCKAELIAREAFTFLSNENKHDHFMRDYKMLLSRFENIQDLHNIDFLSNMP